jgi:hypothetical protein
LCGLVHSLIGRLQWPARFVAVYQFGDVRHAVLRKLQGWFRPRQRPPQTNGSFQYIWTAGSNEPIR